MIIYDSIFFCKLGNHVGDACTNDADGDGILNTNDTCQNNPAISDTSFLNYFSVDLDHSPSITTISPKWQVHGNGAEVTQLANTEIPTMLISMIFKHSQIHVYIKICIVEMF